MIVNRNPIVIETPIYNNLRNKYLDSLDRNKELQKVILSLHQILAVQEQRIKTLKKTIEVKNEAIRVCESQCPD
jgi:hypothetical protein